MLTSLVDCSSIGNELESFKLFKSFELCPEWEISGDTSIAVLWGEGVPELELLQYVIMYDNSQIITHWSDHFESNILHYPLLHCHHLFF